MKKFKTVYAARTIYGSSIRKGRVFTLVSTEGDIVGIRDTKGTLFFISSDELDECFQEQI